MHKIINIENMWKTTLTKAKKDGNFLRTSVPQPIVKKFDLDPKHWDLDWDMDKKDGEWIMIVKPVKKESKKKKED
ncbi:MULTISPECIES: hypothetical protein [Methanobacterium]|uniref:Uncharacterized protein n=1 Tax=Methanobacterium veterum TaxID=408577 RepID=A0A9E4ZZG2_9EURY|nr:MULTISPECIES: hypothetical protein [Methanobacterium]MCZ3365385.1 hypothetical protein [Methanobacterium veterum]MCZ3373136.1 hypothetical protein [Methanobacterium veterum]